MVNISKSKYCSVWQCPKIAWLKKYKPEKITLDENIISRMESGHIVGDIAKNLFKNHVDVTKLKDGKLDIQDMIHRTAEEISKGTEAICEASFSNNGLYCAVDILKRNGNGFDIYEVKSSTDAENEVYIADVAFQKYVLNSCGLDVKRTYVICLNGEYIFDGVLKLDELFKIQDLSGLVDDEIQNIKSNLLMAEKVLKSDCEPNIDLSLNCHKPYHCSFWNYCTRNLPSPSVFDLYRMRFNKKIEFYHRGLIKYEDILSNENVKNEIRQRQMEYQIYDRGTYVNYSKIKEFMRTLSYPLYFLDFETMQPVIPEFVGTHPYQQIPFQYSLHYIENEGTELKHKEFLGISGTDPRRDLAEHLCSDIPKNVCVTAYNKSFECSRIRELADAFPDLAEHLLNIESNIKDLMVPFTSGYYYNKNMGGSFSIKSVLPAIYPNDPSLNYHNLEEVHNGGEAMSIFPKIQYMDIEQQEKTRHNLLKYCELDTYAMVKLWQELIRVTQ